MKFIFIVIGVIFLLVFEVLRVYFIMPFPGSQQYQTIEVAYWIDRNITWIRVLFLVGITFATIRGVRNFSTGRKIFSGALFITYLGIAYLFNFKFLAEKMFLQPQSTVFATALTNVIKEEKLVLGIVINGEAKAYPIQLIGYHHQIRDSLGGVPIWVTYCTVCRTGRIFSPLVNGKNESFRLVGMDHFNALFEDASTKSWWRQVSGEAVVGSLKGYQLKELPAQQMSLAAWLHLYPDTKTLQPDPAFIKQYAGLAAYDMGAMGSGLEKRDTGSWKLKSWVVGVSEGENVKAYDWNVLARQQVLEDSLPQLNLLVTLEKDGRTFHVLDRRIQGTIFRFYKREGAEEMIDINTGSTWNLGGECMAGKMAGQVLQPLSASQEFWHSWKTFHPTTSQ